MNVYGISSAGTSAADGTSTTQKTAANMGDNDFMLLFMAQLRNQNPMEPMDDKDMMGQLAQFNSLQELQTINSRMEQVAAANQASYGASLIGKMIKATLKDGQSVEGVVTGTQNSAGQITLMVGEREIPLSAVETVQGA